MGISQIINRYIENSKIKNRLCKWNKSAISVYISPVTGVITNKDFFYSEVKIGIIKWNSILKNIGIDLQFVIIDFPTGADIVIKWTKVGRVFEGMCKYVSIVDGCFRKISIDIGLPNEYSGKNTTDESIFFTIMHELGHALGLGHGVEVDDLMYVPHQKNISEPSENDLYVLKKIYE